MLEKAAISRQTQDNSLAMEIVRRLNNTSEVGEERGLTKCQAESAVTRDEITGILNEFDEMLKRSGYNLSRRLHIMKSGLLGYERRRARNLVEEGCRHRLGATSTTGRLFKKASLREDWYTKESRGDLEVPREDVEGMDIGTQDTRPSTGKAKSQAPPTAVLFVERTPNGELVRMLRAREKELQSVLGDKVKIVEKAGCKLERRLCVRDPWQKARCLAADTGNMCEVCGDSKQLLCRSKNVVYKHICMICQAKGNKSAYVGMTARVLSLRAGEHHAKLEARSQDSHA